MEKLTKNQTYLSLSGELLTPEILKEIGEHLKLSVIWIQSCKVQDGSSLRKINDTDMACFKNLVRLQDFALTESDVTDAGMSIFAGFPKLKFLNLDGSKVTGSTLGELAGLEKLEVIWLRRTKLNDGSLSYFSLFPKLSTLLIHFTEVTREGLWSLAALKHLTVTAGGIFNEQDIFEFRKRQIALTIDAPPVDKQIEADATKLISKFMDQMTTIEQTLETLDQSGGEESLKIAQYQLFNSVFDEFCDEAAERRYTQYGCHFQYFSYRGYTPVKLHLFSKSKLYAYYLENEYPLRFQLILKDGAWKLLNRQKSIHNKWVKVGL